MIERLNIRDSCIDDLNALSDLRPSEALHRDRIADADGVDLRYLVAERNGDLVGFGLLVCDPPEGWPTIRLLPKMIDLWVKPEFRSQGIGSAIVNYMENAASAMGKKELFVSVDPEENERAYSLYLRLRYNPLQSEPYKEHWSFTSSDGVLHEGYGWNLDLQKALLKRGQGDTR